MYNDWKFANILKKFRSTCNRLSAVNYREIDKFENFFMKIRSR